MTLGLWNKGGVRLFHCTFSFCKLTYLLEGVTVESTSAGLPLKSGRKLINLPSVEVVQVITFVSQYLPTSPGKVLSLSMGVSEHVLGSENQDFICYTMPPFLSLGQLRRRACPTVWAE